MRFVTLAALLAVASPGIAVAQAAQSTAAPAAAAARYSTSDTEIGVLLADPAAAAIVSKHLPEITGSGQVEMVSGMTLKAVQGFAPDRVSDDALAKIDAELAKLPAKK